MFRKRGWYILDVHGADGSACRTVIAIWSSIVIDEWDDDTRIPKLVFDVLEVLEDVRRSPEKASVKG